MLQMTAIAIDYPILNKDPQTIITPRECRERKITYSAPMTASFKCGMNGIDDRGTITRTAGYLPIMVLSNRCHLSGLDEAGLVAAREECDELGGYFIINGLEKVLRLIQVDHMSSYHHCQSDQQFGNLGADAKHANGNTATCVQRTRSLLYPIRGDNALRPIRSVNLHHDFTLSFKWKYASSSFCTQTGFDDTSGRRSQCPDA